MRYFLYIAYRGTNYHGWQIQKNATGVQEVVNDALSTVLRIPIKTIGSGRTDTGVHARQQVVHFDFAERLDRKAFPYKLNSILPRDIAASDIRWVREDASARFSAEKREYIYRIVQHKDPFLEDRAYYFTLDLDIDGMNELNKFIMKRKDFQSFSRVKTDVKDFICEIYDVNWSAVNGEIVFRIVANRFLRGMVRAMVGSILDVGLGKSTKQNFISIVESKDRRKAGSAAPAHGLYLNSITYPENLFLDR